MRAFMISAMQSGAGKTVMSCALMAALKRRGLQVQAFKSGPDYIDPMFHSRVLGVESRNLDLFLQGEAGVRRSFSSGRGDVALVEGAMGYYDGLNGGTEASAWELARTLQLPTVLVLRVKGNGITLAAQVCGMLHFRPESRIAGLLLCDCSGRRAEYFKEILERECGLPVLGYLPPMEEAHLESRHLGLLTAAEIDDFQMRFDRIAQQAKRSIDLNRLLELSAEIEPAAGYGRQEEKKGKTPGECGPDGNGKPETGSRDKTRPCCRIAVARDEAFCFHYADNLDALRQAGAELVFFSPLHDTHLPEAEGLWLCGGYPELYVKQLAENTAIRREIRERVLNGCPTVAECGGFLYLQESLENPEGTAWPMCGALPGRGFKTGRLQRFGYLKLSAEGDSLLFRAGERIPAHEFHYWDSTENGTDLTAEKADGRSWRCGRVTGTLYAGFPHLHFGGELPLAERFVKACSAYGKHENNR